MEKEDNKTTEWDWLPFLSNWHEKEYERRFTLDSAVSIPISLLTGIFAILYILSTQYDYTVFPFIVNCIYIASIGVTLYFACVGSYFIYKSYAIVKNKSYKNLSPALELTSYLSALKNHYGKNNEHLANAEFKTWFVGELADQLNVNIENNDVRTENLQDAKPKVMYSLLCIAIPCIFLIFNNLYKKEPVHQVKFVSTSSQP
ncbi:hypothetical protein [Hymenobacter ruber]